MSDIYANEIQIRDFEKDKIVLFLICPDKEAATSLADMIDETNGKYNVKCYINKSNEVSLSLNLTLPTVQAKLKIETSKNSHNYPPIKQLLSGNINFISTGWLDDKSELTHCTLKPLDSLILPEQLN
jgi:hypothetical protein